MYTPYLSHAQYGYGWYLQQTPYGKLALHSGGISGYTLMFLTFLESGVTVIALSNIAQDINALTKDLAIIAHLDMNKYILD